MDKTTAIKTLNKLINKKWQDSELSDKVEELKEIIMASDFYPKKKEEKKPNVCLIVFAVIGAIAAVAAIAYAVYYFVIPEDSEDFEDFEDFEDDDTDEDDLEGDE